MVIAEQGTVVPRVGLNVVVSAYILLCSLLVAPHRSTGGKRHALDERRSTVEHNQLNNRSLIYARLPLYGTPHFSDVDTRMANVFMLIVRRMLLSIMAPQSHETTGFADP